LLQIRKFLYPAHALGFVLFLAVSSVLAAQSTPQLSPADRQGYLEDIKTLTQPKMEGRGDGLKGLTRAEHILVDRYRSYGLEPAGSKDYLQPFTVTTGAKLRGKNHFLIQSGDAKSTLKLNQDYVPFSFSDSGTVTAPLLFAGYGATAAEFGYDDYAGLDAKDKIVVVLRYEPSGFAAKSGNQGLTTHSQLITKAINARNHGAKGLILLNGKLGEGEEDLLTRFGSVGGPENVGILFAQVKDSSAEEWFRAAGKSLKEVQGQINSTSKPRRFSTEI
jgi:PA domain